MRFALFALISILISEPSFAGCGDADSWNLGENFTELVNAMRYTAGNVDSCWTDPRTGASNVRCEEVTAADKAGAFNSNYKYDWDYSKTDRQNFAAGFINCTPINAKDILENLMLADFAAATERALGCNLPMLNELGRTPKSPRSMEFLNGAYGVYKDNFNGLHDRILERDRLKSANDMGKSSCSGGRIESMSLPQSCQNYLKNGDSNARRISTLNEEIQVMEARIPFMSDASVQKSVEDVIRTGNSSSEAVFPAYYGALMSMRSDMQSFKTDLETDRQGSANRYNLRPSSKRRLWQIADYDKIVAAKEKLNPHLKKVLMCMHDRRNVGEGRITMGVYGMSAISMLLTGGASAGVIALGATARAAIVTMDLAVGGVSAIRSADAIYNSCYKNTSITPNGFTCEPQQSFDFVMQKVPAATCAKNVVTGVAVLGNAAWSASTMKNTSFGSAPDTSITTRLIPQKPTAIPFIPKKK